MMRLPGAVLLGLFVLGAGAGCPRTNPSGSGAGVPETYLTRDGRLAAQVVVTDGKSGIVGDAGRRITIEPSGSWTVVKLVGREEKDKKQGELSKDGLAALAKQLARYDLLSLASQERGGTDPHVITIKFGAKEAQLTLLTGDSVPAPDESTPLGRFGGVVRAVQAAVEPPGAQ